MDLEEFKKTIEEIERSRGFQLDSEAYNLENSFIIMVVNYGQLEKVIGAVPDFSRDQREEKRKYMLEATRTFVNFLTSAVVFKEHTRRFVNKLYESAKDALDGEYQQKVDMEFVNDPLTGFIESLRNFYCHEELPPLGILTRDVNNQPVSRFVIFSDSIDVSSRYFDKGKIFVESQEGKEIDVLEIAKEYVHKTLFPWLMNAQFSHHKSEFEELDHLRSKANKFFDK